MQNNLKFNSAIISITDNCNLKCKYCFVQKHPHNMNLQVMKDIINLCISLQQEDINITFFGGEPTLLWDEIIVPAIQYSKDNKANIHFSITSNGILLDETKLIFMKDNNISLLLSMDGDQFTQDYNRPTLDDQSSFLLLQDKLPLILKYLPNTTIRGTIYPDTCSKLYENMMFFWEQGFKSLYFCPDEFSQWTQNQIDLLKKELRKYTIYFIDAYKNNYNPYIFLPFNQMLKFIPLSENSNIPLEKDCHQCGLGNYTISINYEGKIFGCQELSSYPLKDNLYYIGDIYNGIDNYKFSKLQNTFKIAQNYCEDINICKNCNYQKLCNINMCHANSYLKFNNLEQKSLIKCIWDQTLYQEAKFCTTILLINNNELFKDNYIKLIQTETEGELLKCCQTG